MFHYVLRSSYGLLNTEWAKVQVYQDYTRYTSLKFDDMEAMLAHYILQLRLNYLEPHPQFYYQDSFMENSDDIFNGYDAPLTTAEVELMEYSD